MMKEVKATGIKTWPEDYRPREKLLKKGACVLSNSELLAILLRTGTRGTSAIDLARKVLKKFGTFRNMAHTDTRDWKVFKGLGGTQEKREISIVLPDYSYIHFPIRKGSSDEI